MPASALLKTAESEFAQEVRNGLSTPSQKTLPSKYLYDDLGSALFEAITYLPEYGLTRADERVLHAAAPFIAREMTGRVAVVELGSGSGRKTGRILRHLRSTQSQVRYMPVDVSDSALRQCERELRDIAFVQPVHAGFLEGIAEASRTRRVGERFLVLFLGSTIGNFSAEGAREFLSALRDRLEQSDTLLLGADLVKTKSRMLLAYDDPTGVTAAFNLNLLGRINRELHANFRLSDFKHRATYNASEKRIEMHLECVRAHDVRIPGAFCEVSFGKGETIWTESSHKYTMGDLVSLAMASGFRVVESWTDDEWPFAEMFCSVM